MPSLTQTAAAALASRLLGLAGGVATSLLLPVVIDQAAVGTYFVSQIYIGGATIAGLVGFSHTAPATITAALAEGRLGEARRLCVQALATCAAVALSISIATMLVAPVVLAGLGYGDGMPLELWVVAFTVPFTTLAALVAEELRAIHAYRASSWISAVLGLSPVTYVGSSMLVGLEVTLTGTLWAVAIGAALALAVGLSALVSHLRRWREAAAGTMPYARLIRLTLPNFAISLVGFALTQADTILLSFAMGPEPLAHYGVAFRVAGLLITPLSIATMVLSPLAVELRTRGEDARLQRILLQISWVATGGAVLGYVVFAAAGRELIAVWNPDYEEVYALVLVLGLGHVASAAFGSGGGLLMILGNQVEALRLSIATGIVRMLLCVVGLAGGGMLGLALGVTVGTALQVAVFAWRTQTLLGLRSSFLMPGPKPARRLSGRAGRG